MLLSECLAREGFVVVESALGDELVGELRRAVDAIVADVPRLPDDLRALLTLERDLSESQRGDISIEQAGDAVFIIGELQRFASVFERLVRHRTIVELLRDLFDGDRFAFHFMNATIKSPRIGSRVGWHADWPNRYMHGRTSDQVRLMLCLDGMRRGEGALDVVRGTHAISDEDAAERSVRGVQWRDDEITTIECEPGALVVLHSKIIHGSGPNRSDRARRNIVMQWGGSGNAIVEETRELHTGWSPSRT